MSTNTDTTPSAEAMTAAERLLTQWRDDYGLLLGDAARLIDEAYAPRIARVERERDEAQRELAAWRDGQAFQEKLAGVEALRSEREALREGLRELTSAELVSCDSNPSADAGDKENGACMTCYACKQLAKARALLASTEGGAK